MPFPFLLPFFISHPSFSSFLRCHCAALPCLLLSLFRSSVTRKRTLIAWHSAQTNTSGHRSGERERERERERDADNIDYSDDNENSERVRCFKLWHGRANRLEAREA